jgi:hypothetical protein
MMTFEIEMNNMVAAAAHYNKEALLKGKAGNTKEGTYHCTVDLQFDWFGLVCFANKNKNCKLSYS